MKVLYYLMAHSWSGVRAFLYGDEFWLILVNFGEINIPLVLDGKCCFQLNSAKLMWIQLIFSLYTARQSSAFQILDGQVTELINFVVEVYWCCQIKIGAIRHISGQWLMCSIATQPTRLNSAEFNFSAEFNRLLFWWLNSGEISGKNWLFSVEFTWIHQKSSKKCSYRMTLKVHTIVVK